MRPTEDYAGLVILGRMRFASEPGISARKIPLRVRRAGRFDAPSDRAPKRPFLGGFDSGRTETRRCVFPPQKREKTATPTVGDKSSPDEPCDRARLSSVLARGEASSTAVIPVPRGHPQNIPEFKNSQTRMIAWFPENIPNIPKIPTHFGMPGIWLSHIYIYK